MFSVYELNARVICRVMPYVPAIPLALAAGVSTDNGTHPDGCAFLRGEAPGNRVRHVEAGPGWDVSTQMPNGTGGSAEPEPQTEFVWNRSIYRARKAAKELGS